ncbi:MAG TPA: response regulator transcription factor [Gammaproteobacteria bacterium]|nr:response regulator transcription factor [Gammaproteobacteria bacterium]
MNEAQDTRPSILVVDDDEIFCEVLADALGDRGYQVATAHNIEDALATASRMEPEYAVVDLRIDRESGLLLTKKLHELDENTRIVILTGYASVATAVEAIKLGAVHYLTKPADTDEIVAALHKDEGDTSVPLSDNPPTVRRLEWEHLQKVLTECDGNVSAAARRLRMHRRTLQRKLAKRPARE